MSLSRASSHSICSIIAPKLQTSTARVRHCYNLAPNRFPRDFINSSSGFSKHPFSSSLASCSVVIDQRTLGIRVLGNGFCGKSSPLHIIAKGFASNSFQKVGRGGRSGVRSSRDLPWRERGVLHKSNDRRRPERATAAGSTTGVSSWEESGRIFFQKKGQSSFVGMAQNENGQAGGDEIVEDDIDNAEVSVGKGVRVLANGKTLPWLAGGHKQKTEKRAEQVTTLKPRVSSWEKSATDFLQKSSTVSSDGRVSRNRSVHMVKNRRDDSDSNIKDGNENIVEDQEDMEEDEVVDDPRWNSIRNRFRKVLNAKSGSEKPEFRQWNKQENWGRKTWKEATESTIPRMVGEVIYGVGPVLAALSAGRREFYSLYVQEGLDLSGNNKKKKDRKRFEKVLMMAEKIGLTKKDMSKHDLNVVSDNRPHQGLVLDASPLEMVDIKELDPFTVEGLDSKSPIWLALDEVMDPQNLGAIIRSAYFFGATGVVLCAKNSAPLSGVVSKASAGSLELMEVRSCKNMMRFLSSSAENGWRVIGGSFSSKSIPVNDVTPGAPTILVLGSEGTGLRPLVERSCTQLIRIPGSIPVNVAAGTFDDLEPANIDRGSHVGDFRPFMAVDSLNVSVAAGVLLYHLTQKPHKPSSSSSSSVVSPTNVLE